MTSTGGERAIVLVVSLFVHPGREAEFHRFETEAARIMRRPIERFIQRMKRFDIGRSTSQKRMTRVTSVLFSAW